jgi:ribonuclease BN (tRNA processing enzyme)
MAGQYAKKIEAKRLIITHFSAKYHGIHEKEPLSVKDLLIEAQRECPDIPVEAADDFSKFEV